MSKATLLALLLVSMTLPAQADDSAFQAGPIPVPLPEVANPEQQAWRWTDQSWAPETGDSQLAFDQPAAPSEQAMVDIGLPHDGKNPNKTIGSSLAAAEISPDDARATITGSLSVPLPLGIPSVKRPAASTPASLPTPVDALGYVGEDGVFHAK